LESGLSKEIIYQKFEEISLDLFRRGFKHYSADGVAHVIRWQTSVRGDDPIFKINNNDVAELARRFIADHPEAQGFFKLRASKLDNLKIKFDSDNQGVWI